MIDYADVSDLFYVWLRRCLFDVIPDLFANAGDELGLQDKSQEIIVKRGATLMTRTTNWYERQLSAAFAEMRRVLKTRAPSRSFSGIQIRRLAATSWRTAGCGLRCHVCMACANGVGCHGVASIKVTVTIGCRVAPEGRRASTAAQVEREIAELIRKRVGQWDDWGWPCLTSSWRPMALLCSASGATGDPTARRNRA